jgi:hypothetical protein
VVRSCWSISGTYGCYNCVNTLPHVTRLYDTYRDKGLVVVGIHTPEFPFEKCLGNLQAALRRHGIRYPVAQDNEADAASMDRARGRLFPAVKDFFARAGHRSLMALCAECRGQTAACPGEPRHHSADRDFSRLGNLAVIKALDVTQHQRFPERGRQR